MTDTDYESELSRIDDFIDKIGRIAEADGTVTSDEMSVLDGIMTNLSDYRLLIMEALDDNVITDEEQEQMEYLKESILRHVNNIALADGNISDEEEHLINSLNSFFEN